MYRRLKLFNMWRNVARTTPAVFFPFINDKTKYDQVEIDKNNIFIQKKGIEAVKKIFERNDMEEHSVELHGIAQTATTAGVFGAVLGGFIRSREAYLYFIENNQATSYKTTKDAQKKLQDYVTVAFGKGAYHYGIRVALFCSCFSFVSTIISAYRGDTSVMEYTLAAAVTGALYKMNLGLAASLVGAGLGAVLGTVVGVIIVATLKIFGFKMEDIRKAMYSLRDKRQQQMNQAEDKMAKEKEDDVTRHHDLLVKQLGEKKIEDI